MVKTVATNKGHKGHVRSVKLLIGASNTDDNTVRYLERPVNKLVMLIGAMFEISLFDWFHS